MKRFVAVVTLLALSASVGLGAVGGKKAEYIGGTLSTIEEKTEGTLSTQSDSEAIFETKKSKVAIPYASITGLEYGQKAGRRVAVAVLVSPLALFSKKRKHYLTITFNDAKGTEQAAVFELGKDVIRTTLTVLEVRSKKDVEYQDEEARKAGRN